MARSTHQALHDPRNDAVWVYVNGAFVPRNEASVSVFDSGFLVGDGVWEGLRLHHGTFVFLDHHLDRLFQGLAAIDLDLGMDREEVTALLRRVVDKNKMHDGVHLRLMVTRGRKKTPSQHPSNSVGGPTVVVIAEYKTADPQVRGQGISLYTSSTRRPPPDTLDPKLNCHSKLHEVIALIQATKAGADEALMLDPTGAVSTCNATNFFIVVRGEVWTSTGLYCMNGITRQMVLELCRSEGIPCSEKAFSLTDCYGAQEAFVTGTFGGLTPVREIDGRTIGQERPGPITARLSASYQAAVLLACGQG